MSRQSPQAPRLWSFVLALALPSTLLVACFSSPDSQVGHMVCVTDENCPSGYQCVVPDVVGGCRRAGGSAPDAPPALEVGVDQAQDVLDEAGEVADAFQSPPEAAGSDVAEVAAVGKDAIALPETADGPTADQVLGSPDRSSPGPQLGEDAPTAGDGDDNHDVVDAADDGPIGLVFEAGSDEGPDMPPDVVDAPPDRPDSPPDLSPDLVDAPPDAPPDLPPVDCGALGNPPNGSVSVPSTALNARATYSCNPGFTLTGNTTRTCQANGTWSGSAPACRCPSGLTACSGACVDTQTDNDNCGLCGNVCAAILPSVAQPCAAGRCIVTLASGQPKPYAIAVDASSVYWTLMNANTVIMKLPIAGGSPTALVTGASLEPGSLVLDSNNAYWADYIQGTVNYAPLSGGQPTPLATGVDRPGWITLRASVLYWATAAVGTGTIMKLPLSATTATPLVQNQNAPEGIAVDTNYAYWVNHGIGDADGEVKRVSLATGAVSSLVPGQARPYEIRVDKSNIYWTNLGSIAVNYVDGSVMKATLSGASPTPIASDQRYAMCLSVDGTYVYWTRGGLSGAGAVLKAPLAGGPTTTIAAGQNDPIRMVIDSNSIYWVNHQDGAIMRVTPK